MSKSPLQWPHKIHLSGLVRHPLSRETTPGAEKAMRQKKRT